MSRYRLRLLPVRSRSLWSLSVLRRYKFGVLGYRRLALY